MNRIFIFCIIFIFSHHCLAGDAELNSLLKDLEDIRDKENVPAMGLTLIKDGEIQYADALGVTDIKTHQPVDSKTLFRMGSISKSFVGLAALKAQELGLFKLSDEYDKQLGIPFIQNKWQQTHPILISHLLEHTAGLYDITKDEFNHDSLEPINLEQAFLISPHARKAHWPPGTHHSYSNLGAPIVAYLIEKKSGLSFENFVDRYILEPLGMNESSFFLNNYVKAHLVSGHNRNSAYIIPYWNIAFRPFGALNSSPKNMAAFIMMLINNGNHKGNALFSVNQIERLRTPKTTLSAKAGLRFGYGLGSYSVLRNGYLLHGHGGTSSGHLSEYRYSVENKLGYMLAINANSSKAKAALIERIEKYLHLGITPKANKTNVSTHISLASYTGYYQHAAARIRGTLPLFNLLDSKKVIEKDNQLLVAGLIGSPQTLIPLDSGYFKEPNDPVATTAMVTTQEGEHFLQTPDYSFIKVSAGTYWNLLILAIASLSCIVCGLLYAFFWIPKKLLGKLPGKKNTWVRLLPLITLPVLLIPFILSIFNIELLWFKHLSETSKISYGILTTSGIILTIRCIKWPVSTVAKVNLMLTSFANSFIGIYFLV